MVIGFLAPIVALHPVVSASRTEGATVVVIQGTGAQKGELVGVRESALVLLTKAGDVTIEAAQIESVRIVKKASPVPAAIGLGIAGGAAGLGLAYTLRNPRIGNDEVGLDGGY